MENEEYKSIRRQIGANLKQVREEELSVRPDGKIKKITVRKMAQLYNEDMKSKAISHSKITYYEEMGPTLDYILWVNRRWKINLYRIFKGKEYPTPESSG